MCIFHNELAAFLLTESLLLITDTTQHFVGQWNLFSIDNKANPHKIRSSQNGEAMAVFLLEREQCVLFMRDINRSRIFKLKTHYFINYWKPCLFQVE